MRSMPSIVFAFALVIVGGSFPVHAATPEKRIAFVVGNESYAAGALPTAANDAGLMAQTLQAAGFEVTGARDLDAATLRQSYADFLKKVSAAGPDTVAFLYLSGYGLQYGNDNYYVPIDATVARDTDIPIETVRMADLTGPLTAMNLKARFLVFDAAYKTPFKMQGAPLAGGLSFVDAGPGSLIAYNAAPGTVAPVEKGSYGLYAQSLAAMVREGGLPPDDVFDRVRLRVNEKSKGAEVPWDSSKIDMAFRFFVPTKEAPPPAATAEQTAALMTKPIKDLPIAEAYTAAVARDTLESYQAFCTSFPSDPLTRRARVLLAARREAIVWRRTISIDTPDAYWSYLSRYSRGPHAEDARLRLRALSVALVPPPVYQAVVYDVPPPPPEEIVYIDRPVIYFDDPSYDFPPPPPPPVYWLPPVPVAFIDLPPPPPPGGLFFLPVPAFVPLPVYYDPPAYVAYPVDNYFYGGGAGVDRERNVFINNTTIVNNIHGGFPGGGRRDGEGETGGHGLRDAAIGAALVALPAAAAIHATSLRQRGITTPAQLDAARREPGGPNARGVAGQTGIQGGTNALPGTNGRPLPANNAGSAPIGRANDVRRPGAPDGAGDPARGQRTPATAGGRPPVQPGGATTPAGTPRTAAQVSRDALVQRQDATRQRREAQRTQARERAATRRVQQQNGVQQRGQQRDLQERARQPAAQQRAPQRIQQRPPQVQQRPPQVQQRPPQVQQRPPQVQQRPPQQARPPGFGGGGRPPGFGGGGGRPPGPGGGGRPPGGGGGGRPPAGGAHPPPGPRPH